MGVVSGNSIQFSSAVPALRVFQYLAAYLRSDNGGGSVFANGARFIYRSNYSGHFGPGFERFWQSSRGVCAVSTQLDNYHRAAVHMEETERV